MNYILLRAGVPKGVMCITGVFFWKIGGGGGSTAKKNLGFGQLAVGRFFSFRSSEIFQKGCRNIFREKVVPVGLLNINLPLIIH